MVGVMSTSKGHTMKTLSLPSWILLGAALLACLIRFWPGMLLPSLPSPPSIQTPQPGEQWTWRCANAGPWDCPKRWTVKIIEVKAGWVRYWLDDLEPDRRLELELFTRVYAPPAKETP
jgi:hypothetical protein